MLGFQPYETFQLLIETGGIDRTNTLLIVEANSDEIFVVVRLAPEQPVMLDRYKAQLGKLGCRNIKL